MKPAPAALHLVPKDEMLDVGVQRSMPYLDTQPAVQRISTDAAPSDGLEHDGARSSRTACSAREEQQRPDTREAHDGVHTRKALTIHLSPACLALHVDDRRTYGPWRGYTPATREGRLLWLAKAPGYTLEAPALVISFATPTTYCTRSKAPAHFLAAEQRPREPGYTLEALGQIS